MPRPRPPIPACASCLIPIRVSFAGFQCTGLKLRFETDGRIVRARFVPRAEHIGFKQTVHGGIIATVLDEIMVWACAVQTRRFAYCAELNVRFASPLRPGEEVLATAELVSNRRDRIFEARGELRDGLGPCPRLRHR